MLKFCCAVSLSLMGFGFSKAANLPTKPRTLNPAQLEVTLLTEKRPGFRPAIGLTGNTLAISQSTPGEKSGGEVVFFDTASGSQWRMPGFKGSTAIKIDPSETFAVVCHQFGAKMSVIDLPKRALLKTIELDRFEDDYLSFDCTDFVFDAPEPLGLYPNSVIWVASAGGKRLVRYNFLTETVGGNVGDLSGPFSLAVVGPLAFTFNGALTGVESVATEGLNLAMPLAVRLADGNSVIGSKAGDTKQTKFTRVYANHLFNDASSSDLVWYIDLQNNELAGFSASHPAETSEARVPLHIDNPRQISRYKQCLVVEGATANDWMYPQWSVIRWNAPGGFREIAVVEGLEDKRTNGAIPQLLDKAGNIYLAHWKGVSRIRNLFDQVDCN